MEYEVRGVGSSPQPQGSMTILSREELEFVDNKNNDFQNNYGSPFLSVIMKGISTCNLSCKYCDADTYSNQRMDFKVLASVINKAQSYSRYIDYIWHGGEPTLLGIEFYKKVLYLQNYYKREGQVISNGMQTNGTLLDKEWVEFLIKNKFSVGISLDGPKILNDINRIFKNGVGSFENILRTKELLEKAHIRFGVLAVITDDTLKIDPEEFLNFFY